MNYNLLLMTQTLNGTRSSLQYIKIIIVQLSERTSMGGRVQLFKYPYNGCNSVQLMGHSSY